MSDYEDDDGEEVGGTESGAGTGAVISPSWTWGSSGTVEIPANTDPGQTLRASAQLAQITLPEPAVCSFYLQATLRVTDPLDVVRVFTVNLLEGIGRVTVPRQISFQFQPAINAPLEYTLPFIPVHALQVNVEASIDKISEDPTSTVSIDCYFVLSPITRIPQKAQKLAFGMAMPGEADDLDDELLEDLESEGPTARAAVMQGRKPYEMSEGDEPDFDGEEQGEEQQRPNVHPVVLRLIDQLTRRHGRQPTLNELRAAVARFKAQRARRAARRRR